MRHLIDTLGSVRPRNPDSLQTSYAYEPFGAATSSGATNTNTYQLTRRENDGTTGLYYYRARYYRPTFGRFVSEDPLRFPGGPEPNLYSYVADQPISAKDPLGLSPGSGCGLFGLACVAHFFGGLVASTGLTENGAYGATFAVLGAYTWSMLGLIPIGIAFGPLSFAFIGAAVLTLAASAPITWAAAKYCW